MSTSWKASNSVIFALRIRLEVIVQDFLKGSFVFEKHVGYPAFFEACSIFGEKVKMDDGVMVFAKKHYGLSPVHIRPFFYRLRLLRNPTFENLGRQGFSFHELGGRVGRRGYYQAYGSRSP